MALTNAQIVAKIKLRGFSGDLDDPEIVEAIAAWTEAAQAHRPMTALGEFTTVAGQQEYDLFGTGGAFQGGFEVQEIYGSPSQSDLGLDVFGVAPLLQDLGITPPFDRNNYVFNVPGDFLINDRVWAAFRDRFSTVRFIVKEGRLGSPILLDPVPGSACTLVARYTKPRAVAEVREDDAATMAGVEWQLLEALARKFALSAGVTIGAHKDDGTTAKLFRTMADKAQVKALALLDERTVETVSAATRS